MESPIKSPLSVSVCPDFLHDGRYMEYLKIGRDRSKPRILDNLGEVSFSVVFDRPVDYFSELLYTQSDFPSERHFLTPYRTDGDAFNVTVYHYLFIVGHIM